MLDPTEESLESRVDALFDEVVKSALQFAAAFAAELESITEPQIAEMPGQSPLLVREDEPGYLQKNPCVQSPLPSDPLEAQTPFDP